MKMGLKILVTLAMLLAAVFAFAETPAPQPYSQEVIRLKLPFDAGAILTMQDLGIFTYQSAQPVDIPAILLPYPAELNADNIIMDYPLSGLLQTNIEHIESAGGVAIRLKYPFMRGAI